MTWERQSENEDGFQFALKKEEVLNFDGDNDNSTGRRIMKYNINLAKVLYRVSFVISL